MQPTEYICIDPGWKEFVVVHLKIHHEHFNFKHTIRNVELIQTRTIKFSDRDELTRHFMDVVYSLKTDYDTKILMEDQPKKNMCCVAYQYFLHGFIKGSLLFKNVVLIHPMVYKRYFSACTGNYYQNKKKAMMIASHYLDENQQCLLTHHVADCVMMAIYDWEKNSLTLNTKQDLHSQEDDDDDDNLTIDEDDEPDENNTELVYSPYQFIY